MRIEVAYVGPAEEAVIALDVDPGATVGDAIAQSGILDRIGVAQADIVYAIFGRRVDATARLDEHDRIDITRPLLCDPKLARRRRAARR